MREGLEELHLEGLNMSGGREIGGCLRENIVKSVFG